MKLATIISVIIGPLFVISVFSLIQRLSQKVKTLDNRNLVIEFPKVIAFIGALFDIVIIIVMICFTCFAKKTSNYEFFYIIMAFFIWIGFYLIFKTLTFKIVINDLNIIAYSAFRKPYQFTFYNISSVQRQVKGNRVGSERIIIKTDIGRKIIIESSAIGYKEFKKKIRNNVDSVILKGF